MRKLALAGILSILAMVALSGCMSVPEEETTTPADETTNVVEDVQEETDVTEEVTEEEDSEMSVFDATNIDIPIRFEYPSNMQLDVGELEVQTGALYVALSEKNNDLGYPLTLIRVTVEKDDYQEVAAEVMDGPFFPINNKCEDDQWADYVFNCETEGDWTTYLAIGHQGDLSLEKTYFMDNEVEGWSKVEVRVDLLSDALVDALNDIEDFTEKDQFVKDYDLDEEQLRRIELADALAASLTLK